MSVLPCVWWRANGIVNLTDNSPIEGNSPALYHPKNHSLGRQIVKSFTNSARFCVKLTMPYNVFRALLESI
jgi:hypothetical protein